MDSSKLLLFILSFCCFSNLLGQNIYQTHHYSTTGKQKLAFDFYPSKIKKKKSPTIIFVHGGSFMNGSKNSTYVAPFAKKFSENGYNVVSIDYRLTLKGKSFHCDCPSEKKVNTFENAVYDIRCATNHLLQNKKSFRVDKKKIILAGNSAGAEAVLHAAFWENNTHNIDVSILKKNFNYAGVIAYAGAIIDTNLISKKNSIPTALFHGTCDQYVPYKTAAHHFCPDSTVGALMLSGSYDIMQRLKNLDQSYLLYSECYGNHSVNVTSIETEIDNTIDFINETIVNNNKKQAHLIKQSTTEKCNFVETDFCQ